MIRRDVLRGGLERPAAPSARLPPPPSPRLCSAEIGQTVAGIRHVAPSHRWCCRQAEPFRAVVGVGLSGEFSGIRFESSISPFSLTRLRAIDVDTGSPLEAPCGPFGLWRIHRRVSLWHIPSSGHSHSMLDLETE
ncbi:Hypothetical protein GbCGDNIH2_1152 [Granulibacter bethesdensis]|uniref:Uncharacterized protein n=1 Tax=Granulibacter bethesdensis (strain ATCC BAA-1260 / CGDNIH1) TaxID=391165 RepID=Q0BT02_GRABC|nr:Hypothetical protein GbCGDNIH1_1152 [Granulibacter bethesdensis CGDNIH1]APG30636.1 Hypothetical protein GbCGDNIH2_1152 [Granulibacter bethesdensis]APH51871.1 Hypothetical protein GbCGDNIH5_1152 [Granulibacter bethesdensis]APH64562.1 Hypothetical protein GbCGDNIH1I4_1152 [Granulibacter bethesdensis]